MLRRRAKRFFLKRKLGKLELKHQRLLEEAHSVPETHTNEKEAAYKKAHEVQTKIDKIESILEKEDN